MPESNRGSQWWRNWIGKKGDSSCKISNEPVAGIEISFKEKDIKYLEFPFVFIWMIRSARTMIGELFDRPFASSSAKHNQLEFGTAFRNLSEALDLLSHVCFS
ncbi:hypothetical protein RND81_O195600 [Saponaria officinalis]|uniref:Ycf2 N-terminal domain-containing protein n=1 Tax=Saponaria officinalis TaxID=3572 RepID=A0AAW1GBA8_SAPOF